MSKILTVTRKELWSYFSSPTAFIFLGTYLLISLFTFFWVEKFFSRNIADLRPLFEWMPILLIFLISTLTMRMWSEERRMGTAEFLLTLPIKTYELVLGKFLACLTLVAIALFLTLGLAISVSIMGHLDWGPAIGAYFASLLLASAYTAIGLFVSSRNRSQIVSLIVTAMICSVFYILGAETIVNLLGNKGGELLKLFGTGSRFESISRGVLDLRDIYYYVSIAGAFLALNTYSLERLKWAHGSQAKSNNHSLLTAVTVLLIANFAGANLWLQKVSSARIDITENRMYSISPATAKVVQQLEEPLMIRGYFSARTHPLLAPLVPQIRDLLSEYQIIGEGKIKTEVIDPKEHPALEAEANRVYNIEPQPFQVNDRYSSSLVASYFHIVIKYGDQHELLTFQNLIEVKHDNGGSIEVKLRNPEYDITSRIKKVMHAFRTNDNFWANQTDDVNFVGYVSENDVPDQLKDYLNSVKKELDGYVKSSNSKLKTSFVDPLQDDKLAQKIATDHGFRPMRSLLFPKPFYFYLTIQTAQKMYQLNLPEDLNVSGFKSEMDATLKKLAPGFLRTVGLVKPAQPPMNPMMAQFGQQPQGKQFNALMQKLGDTYSTEDVNLDNGVVPGDVDILVVMAPKDLGEKQIFAIDQFLMKGGTVVLGTSPVAIDKQRYGFLANPNTSGLEDWLAFHGVEIPKELVLDKKNVGFPSVRKRMVQGITIQEPYLAPYPFFVDLRQKGLNQDNAITAGLEQLTMAWASPLNIDGGKNKERQVIELLKSSSESWVSGDLNIEPNQELHPKLGFAIPDAKKPSLIGAMIEGEFKSFFTGKDNPLLVKEDQPEAQAPEGEAEPKEEKEVISSILDKSPKIARLVVFSSNEFLADDTIQIQSMVSQNQYIAPLQLVENTLDWSTEDRALLSIRSRGQFSRTLIPMEDGQKNVWELINYAVALFGLLAIYGVYRSMRRKNLEQLKALELNS